MPELPEVETVARGLKESLIGRTIVHVTVRWPRTVSGLSVAEFEAGIIGRRVLSVGRRGKYVVVGLDRGHMLVHLKMSGRLRIVATGEPIDNHTRITLDLDDGSHLRFHDTRKFGRVYLVEEPSEITGALGPEPLGDDLSLDEFRKLLSRRSGRLKSLLLNQSFLAGLGNIYADESLFHAGLNPLRRADSLTAGEQARLYEAIRSVLSRAVAGRGSTLDDAGYLDAMGRPGSYQDQIAVYGRTGEPCPICQTAIERLVVGGRSTHFCPFCQR